MTGVFSISASPQLEFHKDPRHLSDIATTEQLRAERREKEEEEEGERTREITQGRQKEGIERERAKEGKIEGQMGETL